MNKNKIKILLFAGTLVGVFGFYCLAEAATPSIYVSPATLSKNVGEMFNLSVGVSTGQKVCVVEGKLNLDKLSCQSVTVADGVNAQSSPTCANLYFLIGIPGCTTSNKTLFTVSVKGNSAGTATAGFTSVDVIGEGVSVSSAASGGSYTLIVPAAEEEITPPAEEEQIPPSAEEEVTTPSEEATPSAEEMVVAPPEEKVTEVGLASMLAAIGIEIAQSAWKVIIVILCLAGLILIGVREWKITKEKKRKSNI